MTRVTYKIAAKGLCETANRTSVSIGHHDFFIDEPKERHGTDMAPSPLEYLVGSFVGCTNVIANHIAKDLGIRLADMQVDVEAELDGAVLRGSDVPVAFPTLRLVVKVKSDATPAQMDELKQLLAKRCPVSVLFRQSGTEVIEEWDVQAL